MTFFWESYTETGYTVTDMPYTSVITCENYFLYTRDIQLTKGGTAGLYHDPTSEDTEEVHTHYYRCGSDAGDDGTQIAVFIKPGTTNRKTN